MERRLVYPQCVASTMSVQELSHLGLETAMNSSIFRGQKNVESNGDYDYIHYIQNISHQSALELMKLSLLSISISIPTLHQTTILISCI